MTPDKLVSELDKALKIPGVANAWTMPIKARVGHVVDRHPHAGRHQDLRPEARRRSTTSARKSKARSAACAVRGTSFAERVTGGYYLDFKVKRDQIARYGLTVQDVEMVIESAIGGANITTTIEGRERFPVNVRYQRYYRERSEHAPPHAHLDAGRCADPDRPGRRHR